MTDLLHLDWSEVHDPACKLEHAFSPKILKQLEKVLGHPKRCPHGNPIPTKCGGILEEDTVALTELEIKTTGVVIKITEEKAEILKQLKELQCTPGKRVQIEDKKLTDGFLRVRVGNESHTLNHEVASIIYVKKDM